MGDNFLPGIDLSNLPTYNEEEDPQVAAARAANEQATAALPQGISPSDPDYIRQGLQARSVGLPGRGAEQPAAQQPVQVSPYQDAINYAQQNLPNANPSTTHQVIQGRVSRQTLGKVGEASEAHQEAVRQLGEQQANAHEKAADLQDMQSEAFGEMLDANEKARLKRNEEVNSRLNADASALKEVSALHEDPSHFWSSGSAMRKAFTVLGLALGSATEAFSRAPVDASQTPNQPLQNHALALINGWIDRDIQAQRENIKNKQWGYQQGRSALKDFIARSDNEDQAANRLALMQLQQFKMAALGVAERSQSPIARARAVELATSLGEEQANRVHADATRYDKSVSSQTGTETPQQRAIFALKLKQGEDLAAKAAASGSPLKPVDEKTADKLDNLEKVNELSSKLVSSLQRTSPTGRFLTGLLKTTSLGKIDLKSLSREQQETYGLAEELARAKFRSEHYQRVPSPEAVQSIVRNEILLPNSKIDTLVDHISKNVQGSAVNDMTDTLGRMNGRLDTTKWSRNLRTTLTGNKIARKD